MTETDIKTLFGKRLRQARQMAGFSLRELSDKIGAAVSHNALAKYERGEMMPDGTLLIALSRALKQADAFFFQPMESPISDIQFRAKQDKVSEKELKSIRFKAQNHFERYLEIERLLGISSKFSNPLGRMKFSKAEDAEEGAMKVREAWGLGTKPLGNLVQMLETYGIKVYEVEGHPDFDGFSGWIGDCPVVVVAKHLNKNLLRKRHTLLHELAHLLVKDRIADGLNEEKKVVGRFAAAFTIPRDEFVRAFGGHRKGLSLEELIEMKAAWGISITSIIMRAKELELIPYAIYQRFWVQWGNRWVEKREEDGDMRYRGAEFSNRFHSLVHRAIAEGQITRSKATDLLEVSLDDLRAQIDILA